jgi:hypothetical protein
LLIVLLIVSLAVLYVIDSFSCEQRSIATGTLIHPLRERVKQIFFAESTVIVRNHPSGDCLPAPAGCPAGGENG